MRTAGQLVSVAGATLRRAKPTVSRERRYNTLPSCRYRLLHASGVFVQRRRREAILEKGSQLRTFVCDRFADGWMSKQFVDWLKAGN